MTDPDAVQQGYDALGARYAAERSDESRLDPVLAAFKDALSAEPRLLDAGCGPGTITAGLPGAPVALDASRAQLRLARETAPDARPAQGDLTRLPLAAETIDGVVALWSLIHVAETARAIREFARVLVAGGHALIVEGTTAWNGSNPDWLDSGVEMSWSMAGHETVRAKLRATGFTIREVWRVTEELGDAESDRPGLVRVDPDAAVPEDPRPWTVFLVRLDE